MSRPPRAARTNATLITLWRAQTDVRDTICACLSSTALPKLARLSRVFRTAHPLVLFAAARRAGGAAGYRACAGRFLDALREARREPTHFRETWASGLADWDDRTGAYGTTASVRAIGGTLALELARTFGADHSGPLVRSFSGDGNRVERLRVRLSCDAAAMRSGGYVTLNGPSTGHNSTEDCICGVFFDVDGDVAEARTRHIRLIAPHVVSSEEVDMLVTNAAPDRWYDIDVAFDWAARRVVVRVDGAVVLTDSGTLVQWRPLRTVRLYNFGPCVARYASIGVSFVPAPAGAAFDDRHEPASTGLVAPGMDY